MAVHFPESNSVFPPRPSMGTLFRRAASFVPSGVAILSASEVTMTVSSLQCASLDPPLVSVALARNSQKGAAIVASRQFHARLLRSGEESLSRGEGAPNGAGIVELRCMIAAIYPAGDHDLVLADVCGISISDGYPLVYWRRGLHEFRPVTVSWLREKRSRSSWPSGSLALCQRPAGIMQGTSQSGLTKRSDTQLPLFSEPRMASFGTTKRLAQRTMALRGTTKRSRAYGPIFLRR